MKKTLPRILALVLAMLMVGSLLPVFASAQETQPTAPTDPPETTAAATAPTDPAETTAPTTEPTEPTEPEGTTEPTQPQVYSVYCYAPDGVTLVATLSAQAGSPVTLPASFAYDGDTYTVTAWTSGDGAISGLSIPAMPEGDVSLTATVQAHAPGEIDDPAASPVYQLKLTCVDGCEYNGKTLINNGLDQEDFEIVRVVEEKENECTLLPAIPGHSIPNAVITFGITGNGVYQATATAFHPPAVPTSFQLEIDCDGQDKGCCGHQTVTVTNFSLDTDGILYLPNASRLWQVRVWVSDTELETLISNSLTCADSLKDAYAGAHKLRDDNNMYSSGYAVWLEYKNGTWTPYQDGNRPGNLPLTYTKPDVYELTLKCNDGCEDNGKILINNGLDKQEFTIQSVKDSESGTKEVSLTIPGHTTSAWSIVFDRTQQANVYKGKAIAAHTPAAPTSFQLEIDCDGKDTGCCGHQVVTVTKFTLDADGIYYFPNSDPVWRVRVWVSDAELETLISNSLTCDGSLKDAYAGAHSLRDDNNMYGSGYAVWLEYVNGQWVPYQDGNRPGNLPLTYTAPTSYTLVIDPGTTDAVTGMPGNKTLTPVNGQATITWAELAQGNPQRAGYCFMGWKIVGGNITESADGTTFILTGHAALEALWSAEHTLTLKAEWDDENHPLRPASVNFQLKEKDSGLVLDSGVLTKDGGWTYTIVIPQDALAYLQYVQEAPQGYTVTQTAETAGNTTTVTFRNTRNKTVYVYSDTVILKTGRTTWPIPILTLAGLTCLTMGMFLLLEKRKGRK